MKEFLAFVSCVAAYALTILALAWLANWLEDHWRL